ncbi:MAG: DUF721 domain-containing protein [Deltaproteobacteria bacterium]|nr:DUF721 domain-containing protein [Deltaproteobacteria bacterium]
MSSKRRPRREAPIKIEEPLGRALERAAPLGKRLLAVKQRWRTIVSPRTLAHARPTSIRRNVLTLTVTDSLWMSELMYFAPKFLEALNESLPGDQALERIRLRVGELPPALGAGTLPAGELEPVVEVEVSAEIRERLERIEDPELREQMVRIAAKLGGTKGN